MHFLTTMFDQEDNPTEVCVDYDATYQTEYISGPPEDCHPAYGEMTINSITRENGSDYRPNKLEEEQILEEAWEDYHSRGIDD